MLGGSRLRGPVSLPSIARQQWAAPLGFSRSISSLRPRISRVARPYGRNQLLSGNRSWRRLPVSGSRFNSTSAGASAATAQSTGDNASNSVPNGTSEPGSTDFSDLSGVDITSIPEKIGYLKDLGLDYGWGPAAFMEYIMEHLHIWAGLPWWASVVGAGFLIRLSLLKLMMGASNNAAIMHNLKPKTRPLNERVMTLMKKGDNVGALQAREELSALRKLHGVQTWKTFAPLIQAPLGYGVFRTVYGMAHLPVPGLANESVLWLNNLTVGDPYYILPALSSYLLYYSMKKGGESGTNELSGTGMWNMIIRAFPAVSFLVMQSMPGVLQLYFVGTGLFGACQSVLLNKESFRRFAGLTIPDKNVGESDLGRMLRMIDEQKKAEGANAKTTPPQPKPQPQGQKVSFIDTTISGVKRNFSSMNEQLNKMKRETSDKISEYTGSSAPKRADGSPADPPRLSESDRRDADDYEKRRAMEEAYKREERNQTRRQRHAKRRSL